MHSCLSISGKIKLFLYVFLLKEIQSTLTKSFWTNICPSSWANSTTASSMSARSKSCAGLENSLCVTLQCCRINTDMKISATHVKRCDSDSNIDGLFMPLVSWLLNPYRVYITLTSIVYIDGLFMPLVSWLLNPYRVDIIVCFALFRQTVVSCGVQKSPFKKRIS